MKPDTSDLRLFIFFSPVTLSLRRSYLLSVFTKNTLLKIKSESLWSPFYFGFLVLYKILLASNTLPWVFKCNSLLPNCFSFTLSLLITRNFEFLSSWFTFWFILLAWRLSMRLIKLLMITVSSAIIIYQRQLAVNHYWTICANMNHDSF